MKTIYLAIAMALLMMPIATNHAASPIANCGCTSTSACGTKACSKVKCEKTKSCYNVGCKDICIPKVTFPWQKCCTPQCGKVISVRELKKVEYKCPSCEYTWKVVSTGCGECGTTACGCEATAAPRVPAAKVTSQRIPQGYPTINRSTVPRPMVIQQTKQFRSIYGTR